MKLTKRTLLTGLAAGLLSATGLAGTAYAQTTLTVLVDNSADTVKFSEALIAAFEAKHPDINLELETRPGGAEGDNITKTRLATQSMNDIFLYNSGSLLQALNPERTITPLTGEPVLDRVADSFEQAVTFNGQVYGVPVQPAMGGGILYNRKIYEELGLSIPKTWEEFMANNEKIKAAGKVAVIQTYRDTWTSQLFVLADFFNVQAQVPDFAEQYTAGKAKFATTPAALRGFEHLAEVNAAGYLNEDYGAATYDDGLHMLTSGEGAHYPMLTFAIAAITATYPDAIDDIGFFAQPGDSADSNGLTTWMPAAWYISASSPYQEEAKMFLDFAASVEGCDVITEAVGAAGPYLIDGCGLPEDVPPAVSDMLPYFQEGGQSAPALEFLSPVKGPALEQITVEVGSGTRSPADGAALYDEDVRKQAQQLGLPGW
ncbi:extracellular solute-binding protein [Devosia sp. PTR5]|uniref:Extracellular solute-binding protein n=1 Tax=Devosia oryzisoli TaxID=2774138 RepID=A0A927FRS4_9HYPH|nr:extracellular solute-binding protein [Devosia oryzisoli]MBD8065050.1 extracellular solute-binding protein [Devosia oryzisoli]